MAIVRARTSFSYWVNGNPRVVTAGTLVDTEKFVGYKGRESLFEDVETFVDEQEKKKVATPKTRTSTVESATKAPGEKRNVTPAVPKRKVV